MTEIRDRLREELADQEYRHAYAQEFLDMTLARQIRALRKSRGWSQKDLADRLGTKQSRVSEIEDEDYGSLSIAALKDLATAFDVYLNVRFASFAELLNQVDRTSMADLGVPPYIDDQAVAVIEDTLSVLRPEPQSAIVDLSSIFKHQVSGSITMSLTTASDEIAAPGVPVLYKTAA